MSQQEKTDQTAEKKVATNKTKDDKKVKAKKKSGEKKGPKKCKTAKCSRLENKNLNKGYCCKLCKQEKGKSHGLRCTGIGGKISNIGSDIGTGIAVTVGATVGVIAVLGAELAAAEEREAQAKAKAEQEQKAKALEEEVKAQQAEQERLAQAEAEAKAKAEAEAARIAQAEAEAEAKRVAEALKIRREQEALEKAQAMGQALRQLEEAKIRKVTAIMTALAKPIGTFQELGGLYRKLAPTHAHHHELYDKYREQLESLIEEPSLERLNSSEMKYLLDRERLSGWHGSERLLTPADLLGSFDDKKIDLLRNRYWKECQEAEKLQSEGI